MEEDSPWPPQTLPPACYPCVGTGGLADETPAEEGGGEDGRKGGKEGGPGVSQTVYH